MDSAITGVTALEALNPALVQQQILKAAEDYAPELIETGQTYIQAVPPVRFSDNIKDGPQERYKAAVKNWKELRQNAVELKSQGQKVVNFEVDESVPLSDFFPGLPQKTFGGISFRESSFEYRFEATESQPAGAYLLTEVDLKGALNEILEVFETLLDKAEPVLRLSAYVGAVFDDEKEINFDSLSLIGLLIGCNIEYPPNLLTISQLGATLTIKKAA